VDDDEIITKVMNEVDVGGYQLCFRKMIFIDADIEAKELQVDHVRLQIVASQAILEVKKGKYKLSYDRYMMFAVLCGMVLPHSRK
jgi:flagellum-specific peptidoglycan hydrolase FlgJ